MRTQVLLWGLVGLLSVVEAHAECAWVLWKSSFTVNRGKEKLSTPKIKWEAKSGYPSELNGFALCLVALKGEADRWEAYLKTLKDSKTQSPAYVVRDTESFEIRI